MGASVILQDLPKYRDRKLILYSVDILIFMRFILLCCFFFCVRIATAQSAKPLVQIQSRIYNHYEFSNDNFSCDEKDEDTSKHVSYIIAYVYPHAKSADTMLANLVNRAVSTTFDYSGPSDKAIRLKGWKCIENKPGAEDLTYSLTVQSNQLLSLTIYKDMEPMGMGNGFRHDAIPFTFDLTAKKLLGLNEVLLPGKDTVAYNLLMNQILELYPGMSETANLESDTDFPKKSEMGTVAFAMKPGGIEIYVPMSFGSRVAYETLKLDYVKNQDMFRPEWLKLGAQAKYLKK